MFPSRAFLEAVSHANQDVVIISYGDLVNTAAENQSTAILDKIGRAFGDRDDCLGILAITNVPSLSKKRDLLLHLSRDVSLLSPADLDAVTVESAGYQVGWSHGKEKVEGDKLDFSKGSYYANPLTDNLLHSIQKRDGIAAPDNIDQIARENPGYFAPNVWPKQSLPQLEDAFKDMGQLVHGIGMLVAKHCDNYVASKCPEFTKGQLESIVTNSMCCKARLLHYFALDAESGSSTRKDNDDDTDFSDWCGWHNDHGSLTSLVTGMYLDPQGNKIECPDELACLYIKSRNGCLIRVRLPPDSLAFQIGETSQIHTGGILQATPHAVRGVQIEKVGYVSTRESFAVFMEPEFHGDMDIPRGRTLESTQRRKAEKFLPRNVRTLRSRWKPGMNFGEFSNATFAAFY